ncbi:MAG TPA: DUF4174 domain-containing protein [Roseiflexaceae bacterium]|jgi:hypothetical protein|nr:DUF4174 domain-containing protein [Roseiflexaceae bacterium]
MNTVDLKPYQWHNRLLLIFAPSAADPYYQQQEQMLDDATDALQERDMVTGAFFEDPEGTNRIGAQHVSPEAAAALRKQLNALQGHFRAFLVGKDGGVKQQYDQPVNPQDVFATIDSMPMRQQEMREEGQ